MNDGDVSLTGGALRPLAPGAGSAGESLRHVCRRPRRKTGVVNQGMAKNNAEIVWGRGSRVGLNIRLIILMRSIYCRGRCLRFRSPSDRCLNPVDARPTSSSSGGHLSGAVRALPLRGFFRSAAFWQSRLTRPFARPFDQRFANINPVCAPCPSCSTSSASRARCSSPLPSRRALRGRLSLARSGLCVRIAVDREGANSCSTNVRA